MIAREARFSVAAGAVATVALVFLGQPWLALPFLLGTVGLAWLFYVPRRRSNSGPRCVDAPVDGTVVAVESSWDPWLERSALRVRIELSFPGISAVFSPASGKVMDYWTDLASVPAGSEELFSSPTRYALALETDTGDAVVYCVSSDSPRSRLKFDQAPGERSAKGHRSGLVFFADRVDVLVPGDSAAEVTVGDRVKGGASVIAALAAVGEAG